MPIEDAVLALGAHGPFLKTGAIVQCPDHPEIFIRVGHADKERQAYELADTLLRAFPEDERQAAVSSMAASLETMADRRCPVCVAVRREGLSK
jgi:hypothetical protein